MHNIVFVHVCSEADDVFRWNPEPGSNRSNSTTLLPILSLGATTEYIYRKTTPLIINVRPIPK